MSYQSQCLQTGFFTFIKITLSTVCLGCKAVIQFILVAVLLGYMGKDHVIA